MSNPVLLEYFDELSTSGNLTQFAQQVNERYLEGTLQRLLLQRDPKCREAALVALRLIGTMASNALVATRLRDPAVHLRELAEGALWTIWFRGASDEYSQELQRLTRLLADKEYSRALKGLDTLIKKSPRFAEAYNQRAVLYWKWNEYRRSIADCERTLKLNPCHFGALSGMAQCYLHLKRPVEALRAFRQAQRINPNLEGLQDSIRALEQFLREERRKKRGK